MAAAVAATISRLTVPLSTWPHFRRPRLCNNARSVLSQGRIDHHPNSSRLARSNHVAHCCFIQRCVCLALLLRGDLSGKKSRMSGYDSVTIGP